MTPGLKGETWATPLMVLGLWEVGGGADNKVAGNARPGEVGI
jgi:hypothetical protein